MNDIKQLPGMNASESAQPTFKGGGWLAALSLGFWLAATVASSAITNSVSITGIDSSGRLVWTNCTLSSVDLPCSNAFYQVQFCTNLGTNWAAAPGLESVAASNRLVTVTVPTNGHGGFFRVLILNPLLADSMADFSDTQGSNNWFYGYYDGNSATPFSTGDFKQMANYSDGVWSVQPGTYWTLLTSYGGHPNGTITSIGRQPVNQWAVRRWVSPVSGTIQVYGVLQDLDSSGGNGVRGHFVIDGQEVATYTIDDGGVFYIQFQATVKVGSFFDIGIDPRDGNDTFDTTAFYVTITK